VLKRCIQRFDDTYAKQKTACRKHLHVDRACPDSSAWLRRVRQHGERGLRPVLASRSNRYGWKLPGQRWSAGGRGDEPHPLGCFCIILVFYFFLPDPRIETRIARMVRKSWVGAFAPLPEQLEISSANDYRGPLSLRISISVFESGTPLMWPAS